MQRQYMKQKNYRLRNNTMKLFTNKNIIMLINDIPGCGSKLSLLAIDEPKIIKLL